ncbi:TetR/AcrR family transcriptional regulator [Streptomyces sp. P9(2023)]|uniref:TetR/AcrR family transcriptional regulator n=1 Tax=Streptomyces sp. P9(2023) TaxID=3064394 RepID=UPI0028F44239|nr:TetR/AcrR family transcriptional regulator [Streptomyces sp. P9(2023)]MDT9688597.1 TetR/AcrR family transcriptional regulator [Streptomyces sp. P9(2023)]
MADAAAIRRRGRPRAGEELDATRLLLAALDAFAEKGYDGMSVRELARRIGVSHALLTARFGSKEGLWFAAMEHALTKTEHVWREATNSPDLDDLEALRQGVVRQVMFAATHPQVQRIMNHEGATDSPRVHFIVDRFINPLRPLVEQLLDRLIASGRIRPLPYATLHYLVVGGGGALFASPVEARLLGAPDTPDENTIRRHAESVADVIINGLRT